jgi:hypothetical protein
MKKTDGQKSCDTVPLRVFLLQVVVDKVFSQSENIKYVKVSCFLFVLPPVSCSNSKSTFGTAMAIAN